MTYMSTVTQKGQVTIPLPIREALGIETGSKVRFTKVDEEVVIAPAQDFLSLKGSVKTRRRYADEKADRAVLRYVKKHHER